MSLREGAAAIVIDTDGRFLMQLRDDKPGIVDPGKISLFGGRREGNETFRDCIAREIHEELGCHLPAERFQHLARRVGSNHPITGGHFHAEIFIVRSICSEELTITEGKLKTFTLAELCQIRESLAPLAQFAVDAFLSEAKATDMAQE
ncbi:MULTISPECIES: NUDIX domain-containing protein [Bradyrhizobium]|uniref:NUDIX domain-containing protein n=1 Tax=Bradyrhizobium elkanii TaxID=29448 RepID=UPI00042203F6|nr:NUDIX domain-containing protein [Bradyrhizobium elkanii]